MLFFGVAERVVMGDTIATGTIETLSLCLNSWVFFVVVNNGVSVRQDESSVQNCR